MRARSAEASSLYGGWTLDGVIETLFAAAHEALGVQLHKKKTVFLGARSHPALRLFEPTLLFLQQHFKTYEAELRRAGFMVAPELSQEVAQGFELALVLAPKNIAEAKRIIAQAIQALGPGGTIVCAADNKAGGQRLAGVLQDFGIPKVQQLSKNKARAAYGICEEPHASALASALLEGGVQPVCGGAFYSQPGLFAWDRIDRGSALLAQHLPTDIEGVCGDFGCGYGYLSHAVLKLNPSVQEMVCADADARALTACEQNLDGFAVRKRFVWEDLSRAVKSLHNLDTVVMNPPFHEGRATEADLGRGFIAAAHAALRPGGRLYMVANRHLPYEDLLRELYSSGERLYEGEGYKIYFAKR